MPYSRPIILVTGANSGVGFGVCDRLLQQLAQSNPPDAFVSPLSHDSSKEQSNSQLLSGDAVTILLACRNAGRAEAAREALLKSFDDWLARFKHTAENYDGKADRVRKNLAVDIVLVDLSSLSSIFACASDLREKYTYISHLILNAGVADLNGLNWPAAVVQLLREPITAVTSPTYKLSKPGALSEDGLGWSWQTNVFGHYALFRALQPLLKPLPIETRVIWMSSIEAIPSFYDPTDWQLVKNEHAYEAAKYQIDLIGSELDRQACVQQGPGADVPAPIRHILVEPGVAATNIVGKILNVLVVQLMLLAFYLARWMGSTHHPISPFKASLAAVHASLMCLSNLPLPSTVSPLHTSDGDNNGHATTNDTNHEPPLKFGTLTNRWGHEYVGVEYVKEWDTFSDESQKLVERCERLYLSLAKKHSYTV